MSFYWSTCSCAVPLGGGCYKVRTRANGVQVGGLWVQAEWFFNMRRDTFSPLFSSRFRWSALVEIVPQYLSYLLRGTLRGGGTSSTSICLRWHSLDRPTASCMIPPYSRSMRIGMLRIYVRTILSYCYCETILCLITIQVLPMKHSKSMRTDLARFLS